MGFISKTVIGIGLLGSIAYVSIKHSPLLQASIIQVMNPRIKEAALLDELKKRVILLDDAVSSGEQGGVVLGSSVVEDAITEAKTLVSDIQQLNQQNSGLIPAIVQGGATKILEFFVNQNSSSSPVVPCESRP